MTEQDAEKDIEFIPTDEVVEAETAGAEDEAVHVVEPERPEHMVDEAEGSEAEQLVDIDAEELELEAGEEAVDRSGADVEHEEDVQEILQRHYGIVGEEAGDELTREDAALRPLGPDEFVCRSCFMRKASTQLSDAARDICVDCAVSG